ncbi:hypothetical protein ACFQU2_27445 [Siccirubricoccus deserti]
MPVAPVRLSITNCCRVRCEVSVNRTLATLSAVPPGNHPTITLTGRAGQSSSWPEAWAAEPLASPAPAIMS